MTQKNGSQFQSEAHVHVVRRTLTGSRSLGLSHSFSHSPPFFLLLLRFKMFGLKEEIQAQRSRSNLK